MGHAYVLAEDGSGDLVTSGNWHLKEKERFESFRQLTEESRLSPGKGLPGRVLLSGKPAWIVDLRKDANFPRAQVAQFVGVKAGFAFPVMEGTRVVAVLEFFSELSGEPDPPVLEFIAHVGTLLGKATRRLRSDHASTKREASNV